ncbi:MAG: GlsB/YeaQ/YmgE family stress response membrane protein [Porticoccus sp.]
MGIISWIVLGLIAGILAKIVMPGKDGGGFVVTVLLGIAGAFVGGWAGSFFGLGATGGFSLGSIVTATVGALLLLIIYRQIKK